MDDLAYFEMRTRQEKEASWTASSSHARKCHEELASAYARRCRVLRDQLRSIKERRVQEALENQSF